MPFKPKEPFRTKLSINDIRSSAWNATQGSTKSYEYLKSEYSRLARLANNRMRALEKAELNMFSYDRVHTYLSNLGLTRFRTKFAEPNDYKGMVTQLQELVTFINHKTSTVAGARKALNEKMDKIEEFTGKTYDYQQRLRLAQLLGTDSVSTLLREVRGDSGDVIEVLEQLSSEAIDKDEISSIIDKHLEGYNPFEDNPFFANADYMTYDEMMNELRNLYRKD